MFDKKNFERILKEKDMSLRALSIKTKLDYSGLHNLVNGKNQSINFESMRKICKELECSPNDILKH